MAERTATGPNGEKIVLRGGQWVPLESTPAAAPTPAAELSVAQASLSGSGVDSSARLQGMRAAGAELVANALSVPHATGELLALGAAVPATIADAAGAAVHGEPLNLGERFAAAREEQEGQFPASALLRLPEPTGQDVLSAFHLQDESGEHPVATSVGRAAADIASALLLRRGGRIAPEIKDTVAKISAKLKPVFRSLGRGAARTAEAGAEGAVIGALGEGDPAASAALNAAVQAGGSAVLTAKANFFKNLPSTVFNLWVGHEIYKTVAPGPQDFLGSKDLTIQEVTAAYALGLTAALAGAGRGREVRLMNDMTNASSRAAIASVATQLQEAAARGEDQYEKVIGKLSEDPDYFGPEAARRLNIAAHRERPNALLTEIDSLMRSNRFRRKYEELGTGDAAQQ